MTTRPNQPILQPPRALRYGGFYKKCVYFRGIPVIASEKVDDRALRVLVKTFVSLHQKIADAPFVELIKAGCHFSIIAEEEQQTDLPEYAHLRNDPKTDWNKRARGLGGIIVSAGEENILELPGDRYRGESIYIHEFAHTLGDYGFAKTDPNYRTDLQAAYKAALAAGLWKNTYSATNQFEYWAEGVQIYFDTARTASPPNGVHNEIGNREQLRFYDTRLFALIDRLYGQNPWKYEGAYNTSN